MTRAPRFVERLPAVAPVVLAVAVFALGVIHAIAGVAVTRLFPLWYEWLPARGLWPHVAGVALVLLGGGALGGKYRRGAATAAGVIVLASVLALHLPRALASGDFGDATLNAFKWLAFAAGLFRLAETGSPDSAPGLVGKLFARPAHVWLALFFAGAAVLHVRFAGLIAQYYIPAYLPGRLFWAYFTAGTLAAGAIGLLLPPTRTVAAWLSALMVFLWVPMIHLVRTAAAPRDPGEWAGVFEALAFAAIAVLLTRPLPEKR